jgi:hypothetical protein
MMDVYDLNVAGTFASGAFLGSGSSTGIRHYTHRLHGDLFNPHSKSPVTMDLLLGFRQLPLSLIHAKCTKDQTWEVAPHTGMC